MNSEDRDETILRLAIEVIKFYSKEQLLATFLKGDSEPPTGTPGENALALAANVLGTDTAMLSLLLTTDAQCLRLGYNQKEAAKVLGMGTSTLCEETQRGKIHKTARGLYSLPELVRYLKDDLQRRPRRKPKKPRVPRVEGPQGAV
jgi:hypothetical protein